MHINHNGKNDMKLAIYGDSFADALFTQDSHRYFQWPNILADKLNVYDYSNYALGGTSLNFSYMKFLESHEKYDKIIFVVTDSNRSSIIQEFPAYNFQYHFSFFAERPFDFNLKINQHIDNQQSIRAESDEGIESTDKLKEKHMDKKVLENEMYKDKIYRGSYNLTYYAMIDSIMYRRHDAILIHAFPNPRDPHFKKMKKKNFSYYTSPCMNNIQMIQYHNDSHFDQVLWPEIENSYLKTVNQKYCHMSIPQNECFAEYVYKHITEDDFDLNYTLRIENINEFYPFSSVEEDPFIYE